MRIKYLLVLVSVVGSVWGMKRESENPAVPEAKRRHKVESQYLDLLRAVAEGKKEEVLNDLQKRHDLRALACAIKLAAMYKKHEIIKLLIEKGLVGSIQNFYGDGILTVAAQSGSKDILESLIRAGAHINVQNMFGITPLLWAACCGHAEVVSFLLEEGAAPCIDDSSGSGILFIQAVASESKATLNKVVHNLVSRNGSVQEKKGAMLTPLMVAIIRANTALAARLLGLTDSIDACDYFGQTPLMLAIELERKEIVAILVRKASINRQNTAGKTALMLAAQKGSEHFVKMLIQAGADINIRDKHEKSALSYATANGHREVAKLLLYHKADITAHDEAGCEYGPIYDAIQNRDEELIKLFEDAHITFDQEFEQLNKPLTFALGVSSPAVIRRLISLSTQKDAKLLAAAYLGDKQLVKELIDAGANIDIQEEDDEDNTPSDYAIKHKHQEVVQLLFKEGAAIPVHYFIADWAHEHFALFLSAPLEYVQRWLSNRHAVERACKGTELTPLLLSCALGEKSCVGCFLAASKEGGMYHTILNSKDAVGRTPLMYAIIYNRENIVTMLLPYERYRHTDSYNLDINAQDAFGHTALFYAVQKKNRAMVKALLQAGARVSITPELMQCAAKKGCLDIMGALLFQVSSIVYNDRSKFPIFLI